MDRWMVAVLAAAFVSGATVPAFAGESRATRAEAESMVKRGVEAVKKERDKAYVDMTAPSRTYVDRDLYLVVYDMNGRCLAHGQNAKQVGKDLIELKAPDGKPFVRERVELGKARGKFWQDYKFTDPLTKAVLPKQMYCEALGDVLVCGGVYKS